MEVRCCERVLKHLQSLGLKIRVFATDRSTTIRALMAKVFPNIKHNFDVWLVQKTLFSIQPSLKPDPGIL